MVDLSMLEDLITEKAYISFKSSTASTSSMSIASLASSALSSATSAIGGVSDIESGKLAVQYNPSSIAFTVQNTNSKTKANFNQATNNEGQSEGAQANIMVIKKEVTMKIDLHFYENVKNPAEALIAASRNPLKKNVTFIWGNNTFAGKLESVTVTYNMFDKNGYPLHGIVNLEIRCAGTNNQINNYIKKAENMM